MVMLGALSAEADVTARHQRDREGLLAADDAEASVGERFQRSLGTRVVDG